jgi:hypothetical protein
MSEVTRCCAGRVTYERDHTVAMRLACMLYCTQDPVIHLPRVSSSITGLKLNVFTPIPCLHLNYKEWVDAPLSLSDDRDEDVQI